MRHTRKLGSRIAVGAAALLSVLAGCGEDVPPMLHAEPNERADQMCVVCHTCGTDKTIAPKAPIIDRTHDVCNSCHAPDGSVVVHESEESCEWKMDCDANPPIVNCNECHTVEYVNDLCQECH